MKLKRGCVHIYTGDGKGKTSAGIGVAIRAAGSGLRVRMFQFLKAGCLRSGERNLKIKNFTITCFREVCPVPGRGHANASKREELGKTIRSDIQRSKDAMLRRRYDMIILDEILTACDRNYIDEDSIIDLIASRPGTVELVLTGRGATHEIIERADYVTRFEKVKHPYDRKIAARRGIEY